MFAQHLAAGAELLVATGAACAPTTRNKIVQANPITGSQPTDVDSNLGDLARNLVPQRHRGRSGRRYPGAVMHIGVADARSGDTHEHIVLANSWYRYLLQL
jgi:hypothetical protein